MFIKKINFEKKLCKKSLIEKKPLKKNQFFFMKKTTWFFEKKPITQRLKWKNQTQKRISNKLSW